MSAPINYTRLRSITGGDVETEKMLFGLFLETVRRVLAGLEAEGDWKTLVHELKGACANLGADGLYEACKTVEYNEPQGEARNAFFGEIKQAISDIERLIA